MHNPRKRHDAASRAKAALEAAKGEKPWSSYPVNLALMPIRSDNEKNSFSKNSPDRFPTVGPKGKKTTKSFDRNSTDRLASSRLNLTGSKNHGCSVEEQRMLIETEHPKIPVCRQCELLGLARSSYYYRSEKDDSYNVMLMHLIYEQYIRTPFYTVS